MGEEREIVAGRAFRGKTLEAGEWFLFGYIFKQLLEVTGR